MDESQVLEVPMALNFGSISRGSTASGSSNSSDEATESNLADRFSAAMSVSDDVESKLGPFMPNQLMFSAVDAELEKRGTYSRLSVGSDNTDEGRKSPLGDEPTEKLVRTEWELPEDTRATTTEEALASMYDDDDSQEADPVAMAPGFSNRDIWAARDNELPAFPIRYKEPAPMPSMWKHRDAYVGAEMWKQQDSFRHPAYPQQPHQNAVYPRPDHQPKVVGENNRRQNGRGLKEVPAHLKGRRLLGRALWFANKMGFGFIQHEGVDYFVHYTDILMKGWRSLSPDDEVEFELENQKGRIKAVRVTAPGGKQRERPKSEIRAIKVCAQDLKGLCRRGASCRFTHLSDLQRPMPPPPMHHRDMAYMPPHGAPMY